MIHDVAVIGGGIVGLATAHAVLQADPRASVVVLEKETDVARHQSGRNSGVVHSGIYYPPGSLKAQLCLAGNHSIVEFARRHEIAVEVTGKLIVATEPDELPRLDALHRRGLEHGLDVERLDAAAAREHEPHVAALGALWVPSTGVIDFVGVCRELAQQVRDQGGQIHLGAAVTGIDLGERGSVVRITTARSGIEARRVVNCAGLQGDLVAELSGAHLTARIVPFRGEYLEVVGPSAELVRGLVYPVPDPALPFLGVHLTRGVNGVVHAGPNAVLAMAREGYRRRDVNLRELAGTLGFDGFRHLARAHLRDGLDEMVRSLWRPAFVASLQRLVPELRSTDLRRAPAGVRAQAVSTDGTLVDDFLIVESPRALHVLNAPSPAATSSLEIGREIADRLAR